LLKTSLYFPKTTERVFYFGIPASVVIGFGELFAGRKQFFSLLAMATKLKH